MKLLFRIWSKNEVWDWPFFRRAKLVSVVIHVWYFSKSLNFSMHSWTRHFHSTQALTKASCKTKRLNDVNHASPDKYSEYSVLTEYFFYIEWREQNRFAWPAASSRLNSACLLQRVTPHHLCTLIAHSPSLTFFGCKLKSSPELDFMLSFKRFLWT